MSKRFSHPANGQEELGIVSQSRLESSGSDCTGYAYYPTASPSAILLGKRSLTSTMRRVGPVSRNTLHLLRWTAQTQRYTLTLGTQTLPSEITSGDEVWTQWLATVSSFAFEGRSGIHCTLRKERLQRGDTYWYAYRSMCGRTKKRYLGRTADLSFARLEEVSALFVNEEQHSQPPAFPAQNEEQDIQHATSTAQHTEKDTRQTSVPSALPLLETKLHPPLLPVKLVKRTRLLEQLDASLTCKLTLLLAPAGSGKTTLVNQWLSIHLPNAKDKSPTNPVLAWLSLDAGDNDPLRFWRYLMTACLKLLVPEQQTSGQAALALLSPLNPSPFEPPALDLALTQLLNALASSPFEGLLVLDDYHAISDSRVHETLALFIDYLPATIHVLLLSRSEPPLPLLHWRARGEVCELQTSDLRFSTQETAAFFHQALPLELSQTALSRLDTRLEGWAAGLRLLTLTLSKRRTPQAIEQALLSLGAPDESADRSLLDYFVSEILETQPEPMQRFLLQTSVLTRLCASLCAAVTRNEKSVAQLEAIEHAGLFLEALEGPGGWYRYHALFAAAMRHEAGRRLGEEALRELSLQASAWYEQEALLTEAIEAAFLARDMERVARLIERVHEQNFSEPQTMLRWLEQLPEAVVREHPMLCFLFATELRFPVKLWFAKDLLITTPNGIVEERFIKIGGIDQWITIRGEDRHNPVLFFVHGGPGSTYSIFAPLLRSWEKDLTLVQWDQRGAGKTFRKNGKVGTGSLTFERLVQDGIEIAEFLRNHLGQPIILVGSSVGSITGTMMAKQRPDLFAAYVGTDQNSSPDAGELSYQLTLEWLRASGNTRGVKAVEKLGARKGHLTRREFTQLHQWTIKANSTIPNMILDIMLPAMLTSPDHTLGDLMDIFKGMNFSTDQLFHELMTADLRKLGMRFEVPFFIFQGDTDAITPTASAKAYFDELEAPHKEFVLIKQAGHLAAFARPEQFLNRLLQRVRPLVLNPITSAT